MDNEDIFLRIMTVVGTTVLAFVILGVLMLCGVSIYNSINSDGQIGYCYVEANTAPELPVYNLWGWRSWRPDRKIASFKTLDEALEFSGKMQCPVKAKP